MLSRLSNSFRSKCTVIVTPTVEAFPRPDRGERELWVYDCSAREGATPNPGTDRSREYNSFYCGVWKDVESISYNLRVYGPGPEATEDEAKVALLNKIQEYAKEKKDTKWIFSVELDPSQVQVATQGTGIFDENTPLIGNEQQG